MRHVLAAAALSLALSAFLPTASAERFQDFGDYVVHYNALTTDFLTPQVARAYGIRRSRSRALLTVSVMRRGLAGATMPVAARVRAQAVNLSGQLRRIPMREVREENAIYYLGEFRLSGSETLDFTLEVRPEGADRPLAVRFRQRFQVPADG